MQETPPTTPAPAPAPAPGRPEKLSPGLKLLLELGPLVIFMIANQRIGIIQATVAFVVATVAALAAHYLIVRKVPIMPLVSGVVVVVFGSLTWFLNDDLFIKLKPTIVNTLIGSVLMFGLIARKPVLAIVLDNVIHLKEEGWRKLTFRWSIFFFFLAVLNEVIWRTQTTDFWVRFKVMGFLPITILFALLQTPLMKRYEISAPEVGTTTEPS